MTDKPPFRTPDSLRSKIESPQEAEEHAELLRAIAARDSSARERLLSRYLIQKDTIPASHWDSVRRQYRDRGVSVETLPREIKDEHARAIIEDQRTSLGLWIDYLASPDALYPDWAKYWVIREITNLSRYDKEEQRFRTRDNDEGKVAPFPEMDAEALARVVGAVVRAHENSADLRTLETRLSEARNKLKRFQGAGRAKGYSDLETDAPIGRELLQAMRQVDKDIDAFLGMNKESRDHVKAGAFAKLYARAIQELNAEAGEQGSLEHTVGRLVRFTKGSDPQNLYAALKGKRTGWCTADLGTATSQLEKGDFFIYVSHVPSSDQELVNPKTLPKSAQPRIAFRYEEDTLVEVRGINPGQETDSFIGPVRSELLGKLPDGERFRKRDADMTRMTDIYNRSEREKPDGTKEYLNAPLSQDDLRFLYELDDKIEGFGYQRDPRIKEVLSGRDPEEDAPIAFGCAPSEIVWSDENELKQRLARGESVKAYIGPLFKGIFNLSIEHLYTSFPEGRVVNLPPLEIGDKEKNPKKRKAKLRNEIEQKQKSKAFEVSGYSYSMIDNEDFVVGTPETVSLVHLSVEGLGFPQGATTQQIFDRAQELGLELVPSETGPRLRLAYSNQPNGEYLYMGMKQIAASDGHPHVFEVDRSEDGETWLLDDWARPDDGWDADHRFVFRKLELNT